MRDAHGRQVDYLRISITDRCNERCSYCMPVDHADWLPRDQILRYEEIERTVRIAASMGFRRFRITGGEPLVRRNVVEFIARLRAIDGVERLAMTTNALMLAPLATRLRDAGISDVNISLDSLCRDQYHAITRGKLDEAKAGIAAAVDADFDHVKLNTVLLRGLNEAQLYPICEYAAALGVDAVRFIELMPISDTDQSVMLSTREAMQNIAAHDTLDPADDTQLGDGPARYHRLHKLGLSVGFISAMTDAHFCETCNKMRLTADGFIRPCLGNHGELDLKPALRDAADSDAAIAAVFDQALAEKPADHVFLDQYVPLRIMTALGG